jgi:hypothetical protein
MFAELLRALDSSQPAIIHNDSAVIKTAPPRFHCIWLKIFIEQEIIGAIHHFGNR